MITLGDFGRPTVTADSAQIDKLVLRTTGSIRWLSSSVLGGAPVSELVGWLVGRRSIFGRRMARHFRLVRSNRFDATRLTLADLPSGEEWCFGVDLQLHPPRASAPDVVGYTLIVTLNPTRQLAATDGRTPRIGAIDSLRSSQSGGGASWTASNVLPERIAMHPVADWHWVDAARDVADDTMAFVTEQLFGDGVGNTPERLWEVNTSPITISEIECFWEFRDAQPRQTVQQLCGAFTGGGAVSAANRYTVSYEGMSLSLRSRIRQSVEAVLYPKNDERVRLEVRYGQVSRAGLRLSELNLHDKFRVIADDAAARAGVVLRTVAPYFRASSQRASPIRYAELAGEIAYVVGGQPRRITDVMTELLLRGGITAGDGHLLSLNEAARLVRANVLARRRMSRSRHGRSFQLGYYFLPLCRTEPLASSTP
ncbi:hypothetical protein GGR91_000937 [Sphingorhabdus rigui]|uniref:Uncharacterized protein n=1 Tax=Sphingorhabdus rigui TaxID=1282858 RepID=A0A840B3A6_9SPHN|nr:hypothetical protein [Sphingorhabdus rigui]